MHSIYFYNNCHENFALIILIFKRQFSEPKFLVKNKQTKTIWKQSYQSKSLNQHNESKS